MSTFDRSTILDCLSKIVTPGIKLTALGDELGVRKHEMSELRAEMFDLVEDGTVVVLSGGAFALAPSGRTGDPHAKPAPGPAQPTQRSKPNSPPAQVLVYCWLGLQPYSTSRWRRMYRSRCCCWWAASPRCHG